jgi:hypothetical protein
MDRSMTLAVPTPSSSGSSDEPLGDPSVESAVSRLGAEFGKRLSKQVVITVVDDCRRELGGSPIGALPELVERLARYRLGMHITS